MTAQPCRHVAFYLPGLAGGGAERATLTLIGALLERGTAVSLLLSRGGGALEGEVPAGCAKTVFGSRRTAADLPHLLRALRRLRPDVLLAGMNHNNLLALAAKLLFRTLPWRLQTRVVITLHNALSAEAGADAAPGYRLLPAGYRLLGRAADGIVAVSRGVADDMAALTGTPRRSLRVLHNPVLDARFAAALDAAAAASEPVHPWLRDGGIPVYVAVGRLVAQKDFATLLHAMRRRQEAGPARLIVLGDGPERDALQRLAQGLGIAERVDFAGFVASPLAFIRAAAALVLSSRHEGFGLVLVEALGCGTPVVATDCPHGPAEILEDGAHGVLVPVGDAAALAAAMATDLRARFPAAALRRRAADFSSGRIADAYLEFLDRVMRGEGRQAA